MINAKSRDTLFQMLGDDDAPILILVLELLGIQDDIQFYSRGIAIPLKSIASIEKLQDELKGLSSVNKTFPLQIVEDYILIDLFSKGDKPPIRYQTLPLPLKSAHQFIHYNRLKENTPYHQVTLPFFRDKAAQIIQLQFRIHAIEKKIKYVETHTEKEALIEKLHRLQRKKKLLHHRVIREPLNDGFNEDIEQKIRANQYALINFRHPDFTRHLFGALRRGMMSMNEMMTVKLMYESLFCFNKGQMPANPAAQFTKFHLTDPNGPYDYHSISHWGEKEEKALSMKLKEPHADEKHHYYTINLSHEQTVAYLYHTLELAINGHHSRRIMEKHFKKMLESYLKTKPSSLPLLYLMDQLNLNNAVEFQTFIEHSEPHLAHFLHQHYDRTNQPSTLGLSFEDYMREGNSIAFLANLTHVNCHIPSVCISPQYDAKEPGTPILSFILPTIDTLNTLQFAAHGEEYTEPVAVMGPVTCRMIRAYDEVPALHTKEVEAKTKSVEDLQTLYPTAANIKTPGRPVELTHPDVVKTENPHGASHCHDFLLSWHDLLHTWRNGSNFKALIRHFRSVHDEKAGFAKNKSGMSKVLFLLTDLDSSVGQNMRTITASPDELQTLHSLINCLNLLETAGFDFSQSQDDNDLLTYDLLTSSAQTIFSLFNLNFDQFREYLVILNNHHQNKHIERFERLMATQHRINDYLQTHPNASVVEIILSDLLQPLQAIDSHIFSIFKIDDLKQLFYWSRNSGLFFKKEWAPLLSSLGVERQLRKNHPDALRKALVHLALQNTMVGQAHHELLSQALEADIDISSSLFHKKM